MYVQKVDICIGAHARSQETVQHALKHTHSYSWIVEHLGETAGYCSCLGYNSQVCMVPGYIYVYDYLLTYAVPIQ